MNEKITIFAAIKSFYELNNDLLSVFGDIVFQALPTNSKVSLEILARILEKTIGMEIPISVLRTILKRLRRRGFVVYNNLHDINNESICLSEVGEKEKNNVTKNFRDFERNKNALLSEIGNFINKKYKKKLNNSVIEKELNLFIDNNSLGACRILQGGGLEEKNKGILQSYISEFFVESENSSPENFERLKAILYGKIICSALLTTNYFEKKAKFENLSVYLDSNIVFSLMDLHEEIYVKSAKEIIEIIRKLGFSIKVFSFSIDEITSKLKGYLDTFEYYSPAIRVNSIYHVLRRKRVTRNDTILKITNIEKELGKLGLEIDYQFNIRKLIEENQIEVANIQKLIPSKNFYSARHDAAAILAILKQRGSQNYYLIEKSKCLFLTADHLLSEYNLSELNHYESGTFPEVIYIDNLASILWLKNPKSNNNTIVHNFLASYTRKQLISRSLWESFIEEIKKLKEAGSINKEDVEIIMSQRETENILKEKGQEGIKEIVNEENIKKIRQKEASQLIKLKQTSKQLEAQKNEDRKKINNYIRQFDKISNSIENSCRKKWRRIINIFVVLVALAIIILVLFLIKLNGFSKMSDYIGCATLILLVITLSLSIIMRKEIKYLNLVNSRNKFENIMISRCIEKKKNNLNINLKNQK